MKRYWMLFMLFGIAASLAIGVAFFRMDMTAHGSSDMAVGLAKGQTRTYYIAADEVKWDYAPSGINQITGEAFNDEANVFVANGPDRIGKVYLKSQYREYTDASFATLKPIPDKWLH